MGKQFQRSGSFVAAAGVTAKLPTEPALSLPVPIGAVPKRKSLFKIRSPSVHSTSDVINHDQPLEMLEPKGERKIDSKTDPRTEPKTTHSFLGLKLKSDSDLDSKSSKKFPFTRNRLKNLSFHKSDAALSEIRTPTSGSMPGSVSTPRTITPILETTATPLSTTPISVSETSAVADTAISTSTNTSNSTTNNSNTTNTTPPDPPQTQLHPLFLMPSQDVRNNKDILPPSLQLRPSYHRSMSYQSKNDDDNSSISSKSTLSSSGAGPSNTTPLDSLENTPKKLRQRSRTLGDVQESKLYVEPVPSFVISPSKNTVQSTPTPTVRTSSSVFSLLTSFVKARRSSSVLTLDEVHPQAVEFPNQSPSSNVSDRLSSLTESQLPHLTPPTSTSTDYFSQRSRLSSDAMHKSTQSIGSIDKSFYLQPSPEEETPESYINRLINTNHIMDILPLIGTKDSQFNRDALSYYMKFYNYHDEPLDVSLRKFLTFNDLPRETQQIDRVLNAFACEYCRQNLALNYSNDVCFILTFSLLILHTDHFNANNKRKMTKLDFVKIVKESLQNHLENLSQSEKQAVEFIVKSIITRDILEYFYDNISYTSFKRLEDCTKEFLMIANDNLGLQLCEQHLMQLPQTELEPSFLGKASGKNNLSTASLTVPGAPRRRASSFFGSSNFSVASDPIYEFILSSKSKEDLILKYKFQLTNPFVGFKDEELALDSPDAKLYESREDNILIETEDKIDEIDPILFGQVMDTMVSSRPKVVLKLSKQRMNSMINGGAKIGPLVKTHDEDNEEGENAVEGQDPSHFILRVFKMGPIYRQESKKLSSATLWKRYFAMLTSVGILFYKDSNNLKMTKFVGSSGKETIVVEEQTLSGFFDAMAEPDFVIYNHGLFAIRLPKLEKSRKNHKFDNFKFTIYGKNSKEIYSVLEMDELREWIYLINYSNSLCDCYLNSELRKLEYCMENASEDMVEVRNVVSLTLLQKVNKCNKLLTASLELLKKLFGVCENFSLLMPFQNKTRELTTYSAQLLNTRMNWCWFELNKNLIIVKTLLYAIDIQEGMEEDRDSLTPTTTNNLESELEMEFSESLHRNKTIGSVLLVVDYSIADSTFWKSVDSLEKQRESECSESSYYDCEGDE